MTETERKLNEKIFYHLFPPVALVLCCALCGIFMPYLHVMLFFQSCAGFYGWTGKIVHFCSNK